MCVVYELTFHLIYELLYDVSAKIISELFVQCCYAQMTDLFIDFRMIHPSLINIYLKNIWHEIFFVDEAKEVFEILRIFVLKDH